MLAVRSEKMKKFLIVILATICILSNLTASALDELDFNKLFEETEEAASWFTGYSDEGTGGKQIPDGVERQIVLSDGTDYELMQCGYNTKAEMEAYLHTMFSDDIVKAIVERKTAEGHLVVDEFDGRLYKRGGYIGLVTLDNGEYSFSQVSSTDTKKVYRMVYIANNNEGKACCEQVYDYTVEYDGQNWKFTSFVIPCSLYHYESRCPNNPKTGDHGITVVIALCAVSAIGVVAFKKRKVRN